MLQVFLVGRILLGGFYLFSAFGHFANLHQTAHHAAAHGVPAPEAAVVVAGLLLALAGVSFILGALPRLGVICSVLFLVPVTLFMHQFWNDHNAAARMADTVQFGKNVALLGASLMFLGIP